MFRLFIPSQPKLTTHRRTGGCKYEHTTTPWFRIGSRVLNLHCTLHCLENIVLSQWLCISQTSLDASPSAQQNLKDTYAMAMFVFSRTLRKTSVIDKTSPTATNESKTIEVRLAVDSKGLRSFCVA